MSDDTDFRARSDRAPGASRKRCNRPSRAPHSANRLGAVARTNNATSWALMNRPARTKASIGARTLQTVPTRSNGGSASLKNVRKSRSICEQEVPPAICSTIARSRLLDASQAPARIAGMRSRPLFI
jgi:hypothetical protein